MAAKGGHSGESHNHNDLGSFVVHYRGESSGHGTDESQHRDVWRARLSAPDEVTRIGFEVGLTPRE